ncbi:MAG TPA: hypothetical protein PLN54_04455 [Flavobacteriales bacterium]|nr:hypothetical protein [Flavobacteriales bacterium]
MKKFLFLPFAGAMLLASNGLAQCSVDIAADTVTVYFGYDPMACTDLEAVGAGEGDLAYAWSNGATVATITACDTASTWYQVTVTDTTGCMAMDSVFVNVVDVRCGNNNNKVLVCHIPPGNPANAHTICISENGVPAHLAHGCVLGACAPPAGPDSLGTEGELQIRVSPNPMSERATAVVRSTVSQRVTLSGVDAAGRVVHVLYEGQLDAGEERAIYLASDELPEGARMVWLRLQGASGTTVRQALVIGE